jgi:5-methylcytosine-specific restriction endonuclease McrA
MSCLLAEFLSITPAPENEWRAVILFGRNSATYKFALAQALLEQGAKANELVALEELALPFAQHICRHIQNAPRQGLNPSSDFLTACAGYAEGTIDEQQLVDITVARGFADVLDAFHNVGAAATSHRFFVDERTRTRKAIRVTETLQALVQTHQGGNLCLEVEARWNLVETAWSLGLSVPLIEPSITDEYLTAATTNGRTDVTSSRDALNGYQKGLCFYCSSPISILPGTSDLAHVDHFVPVVLGPLLRINLNAVWNLVLACQDCNLRKSDLIPSQPLAERLARRNEYLINSHHPLRETLIAQTGKNATARARFIGQHWRAAYQVRCSLWQPRDHCTSLL